MTNWRTNTTADLSGSGNTGRLVSMSTTTSPTAGKAGQTLTFNGSTSYIDIPTSPSLEFDTNEPFTISAWVYRASSGTEDDIVEKVHQSGPTYEGFGMYIGDDDKLGIAITDIANHSYSETTVSTVPAGRWVHVVATYNGTTLTPDFNVYFDGAQKSTTVSENLPFTVTAFIADSLKVGVDRSADICCWFGGRIDDVRIYNRALSAGEVKQLYNLGTANAAHSNTVALSRGPVGYWPLDGAVTIWRTNTRPTFPAKATQPVSTWYLPPRCLSLAR